MIRISTTTAMLAIFSFMATGGALAHEYYPEQLAWYKEGNNCVFEFFTKHAPPNNMWEEGRELENVGLNWCIANVFVKNTWTKKNGGLESRECWVMEHSPRYGSLGKDYINWQGIQRNKSLRPGRMWKLNVPYSDIELDPKLRYNNQTRDQVRFILSVNFYTGYSYHHHKGNHTFSAMVGKGCLDKDS